MDKSLPATIPQTREAPTLTNGQTSIAFAKVDKLTPRDAGNVFALRQRYMRQRCMKTEVDFRQHIGERNTLRQEKNDQQEMTSQEMPKVAHGKRLIPSLLRSYSTWRSTTVKVTDKTSSDEYISGQLSPKVTTAGRVSLDNTKYSQIIIDSLYDADCQVSSQPASSGGHLYGRKDAHELYKNALNLSTYQVNRPREMVASAAAEALQKCVESTDEDAADVKLQKRRSKRRSIATIKEKSGQLVSRKSSKRVSDTSIDDSLPSTTAVPRLSLAAQSSIDLGFERYTTNEGRKQPFFRASKRVDSKPTPFPRSESQRTFQHIPSDNSILYASARRVLGRSISLKKKTGNQEMTASELEASPNMSPQKRSMVSTQGLQSQTTSSAPAEPPIEDHPALRAMQATQGLAQVTEYVPSTGTHSKEASIGSIISSYKGDNMSDASPFVIADAKSVRCMALTNGIDCKHISRPGPPPQSQLPSLPEGPVAPPPMTPRPSESSERRHASTEQSPTKLAARSPAKYRLTPADYSPHKHSKHSGVSNHTTEPGQVASKPAAAGRVKTVTNPEAFPSPPHSPSKAKPAMMPPTSNGIPTIANKEILSTSAPAKEIRTDTTKELKKRDLAREKSQKAEIRAAEETPPVPPMSKAEVRYEGISVLPPLEPRDNNVLQFASRHRPHPSLASLLSASTTLRKRESGPPPQRSPILKVAEQEPVSPSQEEVISKATRVIDGLELEQAKAGKQDCRPEPHSDLSGTETLHPSGSNGTRDSASSAGSVNRHRPVANRVATAFSPDLLRKDSTKSSIRSSSVIEDEFELRQELQIVRQEMRILRQDMLNFQENKRARPKRVLQGVGQSEGANGLARGTGSLHNPKSALQHYSHGHEPKVNGEEVMKVNGWGSRNGESAPKELLDAGMVPGNARDSCCHQRARSEP